VDVDPDEAVSQIVNDRIRRCQSQMATIEIGADRMRRFGISDEKRGMASAILEVLGALEEYLPVSLRAVHYRLLTKTFWRNSKQRLKYVNDKSSYNDLSDLSTRMRLNGEIPWDSISDETRPVTLWNCWRNAADFIKEKCERFLRGYARDL